MNKLKYQSRFKIGFVVAVLVLFFALASTLSINQYQYGRADSSLSVPFLKAFVRSELYPNDYCLAQRPFHYTFLWNTLGLLVKYLNFDIPRVFFFCYFFSIYMTFLGLYLIAMTLFGKRQVAFLCLFFFLFAKELLAGIVTLDLILIPRIVAGPILLFSILLFFKQRYLLSFLLGGIGFLVHPMSAFYVIVLIFVCSIVNFKDIGTRRLLGCITILIISVSPILLWKFLHAPASLSLFYAHPAWIELLRLRSAHHIFPFSWSRDIWFGSGLLLCAFLISCKYKPRPEYQRIVVIFAVTIFAMCIIGIIFSEFLPLSIVLNLQLLRSFKFLTYFAMIYFANYFFSEVQSGKNIFYRLLPGFFSIGILYGATGGKFAYIALIGLTLFIIIYSSLKQRKVLKQREVLLSRYFIFALVIIVLVLSSAAYFLKRPQFSIENSQERSWLDVQIWARENSRLDDTFITPPSIEGFRVESERSIYAEWKDGGLLDFNPSFGYEWFRRLENLGYIRGQSLEEGFRNLRERDFLNIAKELMRKANEIFLVMFKESKLLNFRIVYENEKFIVYGVGE